MGDPFFLTLFKRDTNTCTNHTRCKMTVADCKNVSFTAEVNEEVNAAVHKGSSQDRVVVDQLHSDSSEVPSPFVLMHHLFSLNAA